MFVNIYLNNIYIDVYVIIILFPFFINFVFVFVIFLVLGQVITLAGATISGFNDGLGTNAKFNTLVGVAVNPIGSMLYVADSFNNNIRGILLSSGEVYSIISPCTTDVQITVYSILIPHFFFFYMFL
jgi:hypothetical protein